MRLQHQEEQPNSSLGPSYLDEPRYDTETVRKVAALAQKLQSRHEETLTAREIEAAGAEVGLRPEFVRDALRRLAGEPATTASVPPATARTVGPNLTVDPVALTSASTPPQQDSRHHMWTVLKKVWWATGWTPIAVLPPFFALVVGHPEWMGFIAPLWLGTYIGGGIFLAHMADATGPPSRSVHHKPGQTGDWHGSRPVVPATLPVGSMNRQQALDIFFSLQRALEGQRVFRAYLSVDVVGSTEIKRNGGELAVEYTFGQYQRWLEHIVRACGGQVHSAAGDGMMAEFPDAATAIRAAKQIQEGLPSFNASINRLPSPLQLRCGVSAGEVPMDAHTPLGQRNSMVIDRAAVLQKRSAPGDVVVSGEAAAVALTELGSLTAVPEGVVGGQAFSWRGTTGSDGPGRQP